MTSKPITIPIEALQQHIAIVGKTGSGKTYAAKGVVEGLLEAGRRCLIIDPTGAWHGLRSSADGQTAAFPVAVLGGDHADVPITDQSGAAIARLVAEGSGSFIVDTSDFGQGEKHRLITDLAEGLLRLNRRPLQLILDEADDVAPQNPLPESRRMLGAIDRIVRRGRKLGFRVMMISQRPAVLNKNVLSQCSTLVAMRLPAPQDRKAVEDWIKGQADDAEGKRVLASLSKLARGEGWIWAPELDVLARTTFPPISTFDSGRTPDDDEAVTGPATMARVDLAEIRKLLAPVETEVAGPVTVADPDYDALIEAERQRGFHEGEAAGRAAERRRYDEDLGKLTYEVNAALGDIIGKIQARQEALRSPPIELGTVKVATAFQPTARGDFSAGVKFFETSAKPAAPRAEGISGSQQRIIDSLAWLARIGIKAADRGQLAFFSDASPKSSSYGNNLGSLRSSGFIDYRDGKVHLTEAGSALATPGHRPRTNGDLHAAIRARVSGPQWRILDLLIKAYPGSINKTPLAEKTGASPTSSSYGNNLGFLRTLGLIDYPQPGAVVALPILFIGGKK